MWKLYAKMKPNNIQSQAFERQFDIENFLKLEKVLDSLKAEEREIVNNYVSAHPRSPVVLFAIAEFDKPVLAPQSIKSYYEKLDPTLKKTAVGLKLSSFFVANQYSLLFFLPGKKVNSVRYILFHLKCLSYLFLIDHHKLLWRMHA